MQYDRLTRNISVFATVAAPMLERSLPQTPSHAQTISEHTQPMPLNTNNLILKPPAYKNHPSISEGVSTVYLLLTYCLLLLHDERLSMTRDRRGAITHHNSKYQYSTHHCNTHYIIMVTCAAGGMCKVPDMPIPRHFTNCEKPQHECAVCRNGEHGMGNGCCVEVDKIKSELEPTIVALFDTSKHVICILCCSLYKKDAYEM